MPERITPEHKQNLLRWFDAVYVLNLPERTDRLRDTMAQLRSIDPQAQQYVRVFAGLRSQEAHGFPSAGAYGCFQGHLGILRDALHRGACSVLVLEDDIRFLPTMREDWPGIRTALESRPWGVLNLGYDEHTAAVSTEPGPLVEVTQPLMLAHCYAIHGSVLGELIRFLEVLQTRPYGDPAGGPMHYDGALHHFCAQHPNPPRLRASRSVAGQRSSPSNIAEQRWFDRNPVTQPVAAWFRSAKNRL